MSIDKTIRIQDLPTSSFLESDNLIIINDSDNITRSITFDNFVSNITELPGGINFPPTAPGVPGISFCPDDNQNCGTGIGSWKDCEIFISACGETIVKINQDGMDLNGDLIIGGSLEVSEDTELNGNVEIGSGCNNTLNVNATSNFECDVNIEKSLSIGEPGNCLETLIVDAAATFNCETEFNNNVTIDGDLAVNGKVDFTGGPFTFLGDIVIEGDMDFTGDLTVHGDILLDGQIKPDGGGNLNLEVDDIKINGDLEVQGSAIIGQGCLTTLQIDSRTTISCDTIIGNPLNNSTLLTIYSNTLIDKNNLFVNEGNINVNEGDITVTGDGYGFVGDGSRITNLNIPDNLTFKGDTEIDGPAPANPDNGDFYLNVKEGTPHPSWGLSEANVKENVFVYYSSAASTPGWFVGADINDDGLVTLNGNQTITGEKHHTSNISLGTDSSTDNIILDTDGNGTFEGTLGVTGATTLSSTLQVVEDTTLNKTLTVTDGKATSLGGTLLVKQLTTLGSSTNCATQVLQVNGKSTFECEATFNDGITIPGGNDLNVGGNGDVTGNLNVGGNIIGGGDLEISGNGSFDGNLEVDGNLTVNGNTQIGENCSDTLTVTATSTFNCPTTVSNTLTVGTFPTALGGTLAVTGGTTLSSTLNVIGNTSLEGTLTVANRKSTSLGGTLDVTGATTLNDTLTVANDKATTLNGELTVANAKSTVLGGTLRVKKATTLNETLTVSDGKDTTLGGTLQVKGAATCDTPTDGNVQTALVRVDYLKGQLGGDGTGGYVTLDTQQDGSNGTRLISAPKKFTSNVTITGTANYEKDPTNYTTNNDYEIVNVGYLNNAKATASDWVEEDNDISPRHLNDNVSIGGIRSGRTKVNSHTILYADGSAMFAQDKATISADGLAKFENIQLDHLPALPV